VHVKEGDEISVGQTIVSIQEEAAAPSEPAAPKPAAKQKKQAERTAPPADDGEARQEAAAPREQRRTTADNLSRAGIGPPASPSIRKIAMQLGIDLSRVRGSERGGRIVLEDLRKYIEELQEMASEPDRAEAPERAPKKTEPVELVDFSRWGPIRTQPMTATRKKISEAMAASWTTVPHVTQFDDADVTELMALLKKYGPEYKEQGAKLTLTGVVIKVLVRVLKRYPVFNASMAPAAGEIIFKDYFHFGIAVDTEQGLIVPVLRDVDQKNLIEISRQLESLAERTRQRKVTLDELRGGTFTISNQGGIGGGYFTPLIHTPESAILGIGRAALKPAVKDGEIAPRWILPLGMSYDHRLIDGADAARFIRDLVAELESFNEAQLGVSETKTGIKAGKKGKAARKATG
jgi:pyruvate dehydrogenase E2 component (dihydrolipoamide acetyltransferase)